MCTALPCVGACSLTDSEKQGSGGTKDLTQTSFKSQILSKSNDDFDGYLTAQAWIGAEWDVGTKSFVMFENNGDSSSVQPDGVTSLRTSQHIRETAVEAFKPVWRILYGEQGERYSDRSTIALQGRRRAYARARIRVLYGEKELWYQRTNVGDFAKASELMGVPGREVGHTRGIDLVSFTSIQGEEIESGIAKSLPLPPEAIQNSLGQHITTAVSLIHPKIMEFTPHTCDPSGIEMVVGINTFAFLGDLGKALELSAPLHQDGVRAVIATVMACDFFRETGINPKGVGFNALLYPSFTTVVYGQDSNTPASLGAPIFHQSFSLGSTVKSFVFGIDDRGRDKIGQSEEAMFHGADIRKSAAVPAGMHECLNMIVLTFRLPSDMQLSS